MSEEIKKPKMGCPTKYNEGIIEKTIEYTENFKARGDEIPTIESLSLVLKVSVATIYSWEKDEDKADFLEVLNKLRAKQASTLINNGLNNSFNSMITKLILTKHGYKEKSEVDNVGTPQTQIVYVDRKEKEELENHIDDIVNDAD